MKNLFSYQYPSSSIVPDIDWSSKNYNVDDNRVIYQPVKTGWWAIPRYVNSSKMRIGNVVSGYEFEADALKLFYVSQNGTIYSKIATVGVKTKNGIHLDGKPLDWKIGSDNVAYMYSVEGGLAIWESNRYIVYLTGSLTGGSVGWEATLSARKSKLGLHFVAGANFGWEVIDKLNP